MAFQNEARHQQYGDGLIIEETGTVSPFAMVPQATPEAKGGICLAVPAPLSAGGKDGT